MDGWVEYEWIKIRSNSFWRFVLLYTQCSDASGILFRRSDDSDSEWNGIIFVECIHCAARAGQDFRPREKIQQNCGPCVWGGARSMCAMFESCLGGCSNSCKRRTPKFESCRQPGWCDREDDEWSLASISLASESQMARGEVEERTNERSNQERTNTIIVVANRRH